MSSSNPSPDIPACERFKVTCLEFFDFISDCIDLLREADLTDYSTLSLSLAKGIISQFNPDELLEDFIYYNEHWTKIGDKNARFIIDEVPKIFGRDNFDVEILVLPYKIYSNALETGTVKNIPVVIEDIDCMWGFFSSMVSIACNYIHNRRKPIGNKYTVDFYNQIDLPYYSNMFDIKLRLDKK